MKIGRMMVSMVTVSPILAMIQHSHATAYVNADYVWNLFVAKIAGKTKEEYLDADWGHIRCAGVRRWPRADRFGHIPRRNAL